MRQRIRAIAAMGLDIGASIDELVKAWWEIYGLIPESINMGYCEDFAYNIQKLFPEADVYWDTEFGGSGQHCFAEIDGIYYDAEAPHGVDDCLSLPFYYEEELPEFPRLKTHWD